MVEDSSLVSELLAAGGLFIAFAVAGEDGAGFSFGLVGREGATLGELVHWERWPWSMAGECGGLLSGQSFSCL
jgi:hypothetical protein